MDVVQYDLDKVLRDPLTCFEFAYLQHSMKHSITFSIVVAILASASSTFAQSLFERDLQQLKDQRDKAITAATDPINRRYKAALEQLISHATQAKDLEAAVKAKTELTDLATVLPGTSWLWGGTESMKFSFLPGGRFNGHFRDATWVVLNQEFIYYSWPDKAYSGVMRISKDLDHIDAVDWQAGKPGGTAILVSKISK